MGGGFAESASALAVDDVFVSVSFFIHEDIHIIGRPVSYPVMYIR